jgi:hypothetical protein
MNENGWALPQVYKKDYAKRFNIKISDFPDCLWLQVDNMLRIIDRQGNIVKEFILYKKKDKQVN